MNEGQAVKQEVYFTDHSISTRPTIYLQWFV